jgi:uncharacterized protein (DUF362 family)
MLTDSQSDATPTPTPPGEAQAKSRVAALRGDDLGAMARNALDALGGIGSFVHEGESVFIKPNFVTIMWAQTRHMPFHSGECTKPELVAAVAEECLRVGAREVIIGDGSQIASYSFEDAAWLDGSTNLLAEARRLEAKYKGKVTLACLDADSPSWIDLPSRSSLDTISVSSLVANADRIISMPVLKSHQWASMSLSLKNFVGVTPLAKYGGGTAESSVRIHLHMQKGGIEQIFMDIVDGLKPNLAIIDASIGLEGDGPTRNAETAFSVDLRERLGSWLLIASPDLAAADATAARMTGHDVPAVRQLRMAQRLGIGETREEAIELLGERLEDIRVEWRPATPSPALVEAQQQAAQRREQERQQQS